MDRFEYMLERDLPRLPAGLDVGVRGRECPKLGAWISGVAGGAAHQDRKAGLLP